MRQPRPLPLLPARLIWPGTGRLFCVTDQDGSAWYAVRCVFRCGWPPKFAGRAFEERITLWRADPFDHAIERAEAEAREYASSISDSPDTYLSFAQAYRLSDAPGDGAEVFSLVRVSKRKPEAYIDRFFDTGKERQQHS
jgi:hypothetical protein